MKDYTFKINGNTYNVSMDEISENDVVADVVVNGMTYSVEIEGVSTKTVIRKPQVVPIPTNTTSVAPKVQSSNQNVASAGSGAIQSPLPGVILEMMVNVGDNVVVGQTVAVLEAMKMENNIDSDRAGVVKSIVNGKGDSVLEGDTLLIIE